MPILTWLDKRVWATTVPRLALIDNPAENGQLLRESNPVSTKRTHCPWFRNPKFAHKPVLQSSLMTGSFGAGGSGETNFITSPPTCTSAASWAVAENANARAVVQSGPVSAQASR